MESIVYELNKQSALIAKQAIIDMNLKNHQTQDSFVAH